jgi:hypothetical protein
MVEGPCPGEGFWLCSWALDGLGGGLHWEGGCWQGGLVGTRCLRGFLCGLEPGGTEAGASLVALAFSLLLLCICEVFLHVLCCFAGRLAVSLL